MAIKISTYMRNDIVNSIVSGLGTNAILKIYGGTRATDANESTTQGVIVQISGISWGTAVAGTSALTGSKSGTAAGTDGTAVWARLSDSTGTNRVIDGLCGTSSLNDFVIDTEVIAGTSVVTLSAATIVQPAG